MCNSLFSGDVDLQATATLEYVGLELPRGGTLESQVNAGLPHAKSAQFQKPYEIG